MSETVVADRFISGWPDDEGIPIKTWECVKCHQEFVDPDDHPTAWSSKGLAQIQQREYWLGPTEPVCANCAEKAGIPPIDED